MTTERKIKVSKLLGRVLGPQLLEAWHELNDNALSLYEDAVKQKESPDRTDEWYKGFLEGTERSAGAICQLMYELEQTKLFIKENDPETLEAFKDAMMNHSEEVED